MRKLIFIILFGISQFVSGQIVKTLDIADISGADTTIWLTRNESKYSYSLGMAVDFRNITGTSGTFYFLNSPVDSLEIIMPSGTVVVTGDAMTALISDVVPFERVGFKLTKGTLTGGIVTYYFSRKTRK